MVSGSLDTVVASNRGQQAIPRGGYPHPPRIVNAITKQQQHQFQQLQQQQQHLHHHQQQQQQQQNSPFQLRFSDGPLRPWPPMYTTAVSGGGSAQQLQIQQQQQQGFANYHGPHQYRSLIAKHNNNYQLYLNNLKNLYAYNTMKSSASANNKYNKFMFNHQNHHHHNHPQQPEVGFMLNAGAAGQQNGHLAAAASAAANKSKEQHFMQSYFRSQKNMNHQQQQQQLQQQGYQKAGSVYSLKDHGGGNNSSSMSESEQKQIRRMRSTQSMPPGSACGCNGRSKSMEDIRDVIVDWTPEVAAINGAKQKLMNNAALLNNGSANSNYFMNQKNNHNNQGGGVGSGNSKHSETYGYNSNNRRFIANANYIINGQLANIKNKNNMRRSMDNLLDIETNYTPQFNTQVFDGDSIGRLWGSEIWMERRSSGDYSFRWVPFYIKRTVFWRSTAISKGVLRAALAGVVQHNQTQLQIHQRV